MPMPRRRQKYTRQELMLQAAQRGDIDGIFKVVNQSPCPIADEEDSMAALRVALEKLAGDPQRLVEELLTQVLRSQSILMFRCQRYIDREIADADRRCPGGSDIPKQIAEEWMPRLSKLQREVQDTSRCLSTVRHGFALSKHGPIKSRGAKNVIKLSDERSREAAGD